MADFTAFLLFFLDSYAATPLN